MKNNFVFFGTDDFSVTILEELKRAGFLPALVVTMPDRPKGRELALTPPPVKIWAQKNKIAFFQLEKLDTTGTILLASKIVDYFVVASYGKIIPKAIVDIPEKGVLNVHPSLLPKYRGAAPIESQILADEKKIGVSVMLMDEQMDHGPIVAQRQWESTKQKTQNPKVSELRKILAEEGGKLLAETIPKWLAGEIKPKPQDESKATYTKKLTKKDGEINLSDNLYPNEAERRRRAYKNFLKIRAFDGSIGSYFFYKKKRVVIKSAEYENNELIITRVLPAGKKEISYEEFLRGIK